MVDLKFSNVSKRYRVRQEVAADMERHPIVRKIQSLRRPALDFWAVRDLSFEVERGESLGIIGHNGAGKSTILKLLANITAPTTGEIQINGRLSALIEVGSGFHPELTGRENIYLNGSILGMRRAEITEKLDSIVEFAGVRQFLDTPVKRFSSGMYVRLGFSIAAHLDPDILLLDEVLAVGDAAFQAKCLDRIKELKRAGTTIVFISHDLAAVQNTCDRVLLLQQGEVTAEGLPKDVIESYHQASTGLLPIKSGSSRGVTSNSSERVDVLSVEFYDLEGNKSGHFASGSAFKVVIDFTSKEEFENVAFDLYINSSEGPLQCLLTTEGSDRLVHLTPGCGKLEFTCPELSLREGVYFMDLHIKLRDSVQFLAVATNCATLHVDPGKAVRGGLFHMPHHWKVSPKICAEQLNSGDKLRRNQ